MYKVYLDMLCKSGKDVFINYGHDSYGYWTAALACMACDDMNAVDESKGLIAFLGEHPGIKGMMLRNLEPWVIICLMMHLNFNSLLCMIIFSFNFSYRKLCVTLGPGKIHILLKGGLHFFFFMLSTLIITEYLYKQKQRP